MNWGNNDNNSDKEERRAEVGIFRKYAVPSMGAIGGVVLGGAIWFMATRYHVCLPHQVMVRTGWGVTENQGMAVIRRGLQWPFQRMTKFAIQPTHVHFTLQNMTKEKVEFKLPVVLTYMPADPQTDLPRFLAFAKRISALKGEDVKAMVEAVANGESRLLTAQMTIEDMFSDRLAYRERLEKKLDEQLGPIGIRVVNCNIEEMSDQKGNRYFGTYFSDALFLSHLLFLAVLTVFHRVHAPQCAGGGREQGEGRCGRARQIGRDGFETEGD